MEEEHPESVGGVLALFKPLAEWAEVRMVEDATGIPAREFAKTFMKAAVAFDEGGCGPHISQTDNFKVLRETLRREYTPGMSRDEAFALGAALGIAYVAVAHIDTTE